MKPFSRHSQAFTLAEVIVAAAITAILAMGILTYGSMMLRMTARNLAVNHGHDAARASLERLMSDLRSSASQFTLFNVSTSGTTTTYTDVTPSFSSSSDTDLFFTPQQNYLINDNRANGVRYMRLAGTGPYQLTGDGVTDSGTIAPTSTTLEFDFQNSGYVPSIGDKLQIPLIYSGEYDIISTPTKVSGTKYKVTISQATGYYLYTGTSKSNTGIVYNSSNPANTAGYFYQRLAYTVYNNQLRYHPNFTDPSSGGTLISYPATWTATASDVPVVVRNNVLSVAPFSLLTSGTGVTENTLYLRVSLVAYDLNYSSRSFANGTTTIQAIIPSRSTYSDSSILSTNAR